MVKLNTFALDASKLWRGSNKVQYVSQCKSSRIYKAPFTKILVDAQQIKTHAMHKPHLSSASSILSHRLIRDRDSPSSLPASSILSQRLI